MIKAFLSGIFWALNSVILGIALTMSGFCSSTQAIFLAPFISTFLNDLFSFMLMLFINLITGKLPTTFREYKTKYIWLYIIAAILSGPLGMTGYVLSISYMGSSLSSMTSVLYIAIGVLFSRVCLKEKLKWHQYFFLVLCLLSIYLMSFSTDVSSLNFWLGLLGIALCSIGWGLEAVLVSYASTKKELSTNALLQVKYGCSSIIYAGILLPALSAWPMTCSIIVSSDLCGFVIIGAAICGTISYLCYYSAINNIGASKAMSLNILYVVWAFIINLCIYQNFESYNWLSYVCIIISIICAFFTANDITKIFKKENKHE